MQFRQGFYSNHRVKIQVLDKDATPPIDDPLRGKYCYQGRKLDELYRMNLEHFLSKDFEYFLRCNFSTKQAHYLHFYPDGRMVQSPHYCDIEKGICIKLTMRLTEQEKTEYPINYDRCKYELRVALEESLLRLR